MRYFKGFVLRWLADVAQLCPWTRERVAVVTETSASAAIRTCSGEGHTCGTSWTGAGPERADGGLAEEMNVLSALVALLRRDDGVAASGGDILTLDTGATSTGDAHAGDGSRRRPGLRALEKITRASVAAASILTCLILVSAMAMFTWICTDMLEKHETNRVLDEPVVFDVPILPALPCPTHQHDRGTRSSVFSSRRAGPSVQITELDLEPGQVDAHISEVLSNEWPIVRARGRTMERRQHSCK